MELDMDEKGVSQVSPTPMDIDEPTNLAVTDASSESSMTKSNKEKMVEVLDTGGLSPESSLTEMGTAPQGTPISLGSPKIPVISKKEVEAVPTATKVLEDDSKIVISSSSQRRKKKPAPSPKKYNVEGYVEIIVLR